MNLQDFNPNGVGSIMATFPHRSFFSNKMTSAPFSAALIEAKSPAAPPPITITLLFSIYFTPLSVCVVDVIFCPYLFKLVESYAKLVLLFARYGYNESVYNA